MFPSLDVADGPRCAGHDPELWFDSARWAQAMGICHGCSLRAECLAASFTLPPQEQGYGIWGGLPPAERQRIRKRYRTVTLGTAEAILDQAK